MAKKPPIKASVKVTVTPKTTVTTWTPDTPPPDPAKPGVRVEVKNFSFAAGSPFPQHAAEPIGKRLYELQHELGRGLVSEDTLREAERPESPLHPFVDWNDRTAAQAHRLGQCGAINRALIADVLIITPDPVTRKPIVWQGSIRALPKVTPHQALPNGGPAGRVSMPIVDVLNDQEWRNEMVADALRTMASWVHRFSHLHELNVFFDKIKEAQRIYDENQKRKEAQAS